MNAYTSPGQCALFAHELKHAFDFFNEPPPGGCNLECYDVACLEIQAYAGSTQCCKMDESGEGVIDECCIEEKVLDSLATFNASSGKNCGQADIDAAMPACLPDNGVCDICPDDGYSESCEPCPGTARPEGCGKASNHECPCEDPTAGDPGNDNCPNGLCEEPNRICNGGTCECAEGCYEANDCGCFQDGYFCQKDRHEIDIWVAHATV